MHGTHITNESNSTEWNKKANLLEQDVWALKSARTASHPWRPLRLAGEGSQDVLGVGSVVDAVQRILHPGYAVQQRSRCALTRTGQGVTTTMLPAWLRLLLSRPNL